jgi:hypothetical protein
MVVPMSDKNKTSPADKPKRRPYQPPELKSEETFERDAVLGCGKVSGPGACTVVKRAS